MRPYAKTAAIVVCALIGACVVVLAWRRGDPGRVSNNLQTRKQESAAFVERGKQAYRKLPVREINSQTERTDILELLQECWIAGSPPTGAGSVDAVRQAAAEFIHTRFAAPSRTEYEQWRKSTGAHRREYADIVTLAGVYYQHYFGVPPPTEGDAAELFSQLWQEQVEKQDPRATIKAIASSDEGLIVTFGRITPANRVRDPFATADPGSLGKELWVGMQNASSPSWWNTWPSETDLFKANGAITYAEVGFIAEFANGSRRPLFLTFFWDPTIRRWRLEYLNQYNFDPADTVVLIW